MQEGRSQPREMRPIPQHVEAGIGLHFDFRLLEELDPSIHQAVAEKLIDASAAYQMLANREKFKNIDERKLIDKILKGNFPDALIN